jgi:hypothetical protein
MDLPIRPDVGMRAVRVFHIPVEVFLPTARRRMRNPLIAVVIEVAPLRAPRRIP